MHGILKWTIVTVNSDVNTLKCIPYMVLSYCLKHYHDIILIDFLSYDVIFFLGNYVLNYLANWPKLTAFVSQSLVQVHVYYSSISTFMYLNYRYIYQYKLFFTKFINFSVEAN